MKGRSSIWRKHIGNYTYQSIPQYQPWGAGTWSQDQPRSCAELSGKYILRSAYSTVVYNRNKSRLLQKRHNTVFRSIQDQEKVTAPTVQGPEDGSSGKGLSAQWTEAPLPRWEPFFHVGYPASFRRPTLRGICLLGPVPSHLKPQADPPCHGQYNC